MSDEPSGAELIGHRVDSDGQPPTGERVFSSPHEAAGNVAVMLQRLLRLDERSDSAVSRIAVTLGTDIIEGRRQPGDDVNTLELSRQFNTSRTPVREALLLLEKEGLVDIPARRRPRVAVTDPTVVQEIYRVRAILLGLACEFICERATETDIQLLWDGFQSMRTAAELGDIDAYFWANIRFHDQLLETSGNTTLRRILESLGLRVLRLRRLSMSLPGRLAQSVDDNEHLLHALEERNVALSSTLNHSMILRALQAIERSRGQE